MIFTALVKGLCIFDSCICADGTLYPLWFHLYLHLRSQVTFSSYCEEKWWCIYGILGMPFCEKDTIHLFAFFKDLQDFFPVTCKARFPSARISSKPTVTLVYYVTSHVVFSVTGSTSQKLRHSLTKCSSCPSFLPAVTHALPCRKRALSERNACLHWSQFDDLCHAYQNPTITVDHQQFMLDGNRKVVLGYLLA